MTTSIWSTYAGNRALAHNFGDSNYLALHLTDPGVTGDTATEVAGGGYVRKLIHWSSPSAKSIVNTTAPIFSAMPACTVLWIATWDSVTGGNMISRKELDDPIVVLVDGQVRLAIGDIAWSV